MSFLDLIRPKKEPTKTVRWEELGTFQAYFSLFGNDIYKSSEVRSCIRALALHTSKAVAHADKRIEYILNYNPNIYMDGAKFLQKVRNYYEIYNTCFILIDRNDRGQISSYYPIPTCTYEALEYENELYIKFYFNTGKIMVASWKDLAVLCKDFNTSDIAGDSNEAILETLDVIKTANQGIKNAVKSTANLRGIIKATKAMLAQDKVREMKDEFVQDYINLENRSGIAALDATLDFIPVNMQPITTNAAQQKEFKEAVQRYFGVNDAIITNSMTAEQMDIFYEGQIAPFLNQLSLELTRKSLKESEILEEKEIFYDCNKLQFASIDKKIKLFQTVVLYGGMTINEWRAISGMDAIEGGDDPIRRLDAATVEMQEGEDDGSKE